ncbi:HAD hydrolase family protein, partial [[Eubacterium] rectale]
SIEIDKGLALRRIANERGWDLTNFISIGNFPSDIHLFDETGFNIVIENNKNLKNIKNIKNIQIISNDNISTLLDRV